MIYKGFYAINKINIKKIKFNEIQKLILMLDGAIAFSYPRVIA